MKLQLKLICNSVYVYVSKGEWDKECQQLKLVMTMPWSEFNILKSIFERCNVNFEYDDYY